MLNSRLSFFRYDSLKSYTEFRDSDDGAWRGEFDDES